MTATPVDITPADVFPSTFQSPGTSQKANQANFQAIFQAYANACTYLKNRIGSGPSVSGFSVRLATTANITLSGTQTIDGVSAGVDDAVLVKSQSSAAQNGPYLVKSGAWVRHPNFDASAEAIPMTLFGVSEGTANGNKVFALTTDAPITLGVTALSFAELATGASGSAGGDLAGTYPNPTVTQATGAGGLFKLLATLVGDQGTSSPVKLGRSAVSITDADTALTAAQYVNPIIDVTSSAPLTVPRVITLPGVTGAHLWVFNNTTGGKGLTFKASSGTGVTLPVGGRALIHFDGTNYVEGAPRAFMWVAGADANVTALPNTLLRMPTLTVGRQVDLPASPNDGDFVGVWATNGITFAVTVSGNGHNINDGFNTPGSTNVIANDGQFRVYVYDATNTEWKILFARTPLQPAIMRALTTRFSPVALYNFSGVLTDGGGSGLNLANHTGNVQYCEIGPRCQGLALNGATAVRRATRTTQLDIVSALTIQFAFMPTVSGTATRKWLLTYAGSVAALAGTSANDKMLYGVCWTEPATANAPGFGVLTLAWENDAGTDFEAKSTYLIPINKTTHVTFTRSTGGHVLLYIDGVFVEDLGTLTMPGAIGGAPTQQLTVGGDSSGTAINFVTGGMEGLKISNTEFAAAPAFQDYTLHSGL